jgi:hypothetical protein
MPSLPSFARRVIIAFLLLLTTFVYARGLGSELTFDDRRTVESNLGIRQLGPYLHIAPWVGSSRGGRILTDFTYALNYAMGRLDPFSYHATNLAIHLGAVLLVYWFVRKLLVCAGLADRADLSVVVALVFALHPLQTEAVVYVSQRSESLASVLYLGEILLILEAERHGVARSGVVLYLASFAVHVLGMGAKIIGLTAPIAYLLIGVLPGSIEGRRKLARFPVRLALAMPATLYSLVVAARVLPTFRAPAQGLEVAGFNLPSLPPGRYFLTQWRVVVTYLRLMLWPSSQNIDWDLPVARGLGDPRVALCGVLLMTLLLGAGYVLYRCRARTDAAGSVGRIVAFGVFWFFVVLSPSSSVVPLLDVLAEHRLYLPSMGIFLAVAVAADYAIGRLLVCRARLSRILLLVICTGLAMLTYRRVGVWRSGLLLWADAAAQSPHKRVLMQTWQPLIGRQVRLRPPSRNTFWRCS